MKRHAPHQDQNETKDTPVEEAPIKEQAEEQADEQQLAPESAELSQVQIELELMKDKLLRAVAETENIRKRALRDQEDTLKYAISNFARDVLSVADNLRRALESFPKENQASLPPELKSVLEGVEITERELASAFKKYHIQQINPIPGTPFDPAVHQAMFEVETTEHAPGTIAQVMQAGYTLHDRLLRPALVGTAKTKKSE